MKEAAQLDARYEVIDNVGGHLRVYRGDGGHLMFIVVWGIGGHLFVITVHMEMAPNGHLGCICGW